MATPTINNQLDLQFFQRIQNTITTVQAWDADPLLLAECRLMIPWDEIRKDNHGKYWEERDRLISCPSARFVQRLARWFKDRMQWVNQPTCTSCGSTSQEKVQISVRGPQTMEEREGATSRIEVYRCNDCSSMVEFPRYNSVRKLLQTWQGRCGEYANLFGLVCRAVGYETRYILDVTDHVWTEVYIPDYNRSCNWIMIDSCEGVIDENSMYEAGWGKKLSMILAISKDYVMDVTSRYSRQYNTSDFQLRRKQFISSEHACSIILEQCNALLRQGLDDKSISVIKQRLLQEQNILQQYKSMNQWDKEYANGRISGSSSWKHSRNESGKYPSGSGNTTAADKESDANISTFYVESYMARNDKNKITIAVSSMPTRSQHDSIVVAGVPCAIGGNYSDPSDTNSVTASVVVLDETILCDNTICILQSKALTTLTSLSNFISSIPIGRIVVIHGKVTDDDDGNKGDDDDEKNSDNKVNSIIHQQLLELGGFDVEMILSQYGVMYIGQVGYHPKWAVCCGIESNDDNNTNAPKNTTITIEATTSSTKDAPKDDTNYNTSFKLRTIRGVRPTSVVGRVDDSIMPLQTQLDASYEQKRIAFLAFIDSLQHRHNYSGYTTKLGAPIYLLGNSSFPFNSSTPGNELNKMDTWNTFLLLPSSLVDPNDCGIPDSEVGAPNNNIDETIAKFEIPIDDVFFVQHLGSDLLEKSMKPAIHTLDAIRNSRLVGLYFSAHWCGPCRSFTPMLAEMYEYLKQEYSTHGLEIIFVSSDRDHNSFVQYYSTMPWLAVPFECLAVYKQLLSAKYGIRGIPALVILDSMSGEIVVPPGQSRQEVMTACNRGEAEISNMFQNWLGRVPPASREIVEMLSISCADIANRSEDRQEPSDLFENKYLIRPEYAEAKERIATLVTQLVEDGMEEDEAFEAAKEIENVSSQTAAELSLVPGPLDESFVAVVINAEKNHTTEPDPENIARAIASESGSAAVTTIVSTLVKYIGNAKKEPWTTKFRSFNLSFKVADRITRVTGGIPLIESLGVTVYGSTDGFVASIPYEADLDVMYTKSMDILEMLKTL